MTRFDQELSQRLESLREQGLYRELRRVDSPQTTRIEISGKTYLNFSSNDYLGLAFEPEVRAAASEAAANYGAGSGASRLICGSLKPHHELEETLADFKGTEAALAFSSGYATAVGTIGALVGKDDVIVVDKLVHACVVDAARLCGAALRVFAHNDMNDLDAVLRWASERASKQTGTHCGRTLVVTESVFSMDGDHAPLREMVELKERHGAWLMVDEAHGVGLYGTNGRGLADELGVAQRIDAQMGTLGKALGASGGYICGSRVLIDYLVNRARSFIFSTAPVPAAAAAARTAITLARGPLGDQRRTRLWSLCASLTGLKNKNGDGTGFTGLTGFEESDSEFSVLNPVNPVNPVYSQNRSVIIPIHIGDESEALRVAAALREEGIFIPAVRFPTVARGTARLRLTVSAAHQPEDVQRLIEALTRLNVRL